MQPYTSFKEGKLKFSPPTISIQFPSPGFRIVRLSYSPVVVSLTSIVTSGDAEALETMHKYVRTTTANATKSILSAVRFVLSHIVPARMMNFSYAPLY